MLVSGDVLAFALKSGTQVALRRARADDAHDLVEIQRQVVEENVANVDDHIDTVEDCRGRIASTDPGDLWMVAEANGHVVGTLRLMSPGPSFLKHIRNLFIDIHEDWRGQGLGTALISAGTEWATANGVEMLALSVLDSNPRARQLYQRLRFTVTGHTSSLVKRPDGTYSDDTQMILRLSRDTSTREVEKRKDEPS